MDIVMGGASIENPKELIDELFSVVDSIPMYVLTNSTGINGAACMMYENVLKEFAEMMQSDLIILPSSLHEVLLMLDDGVSEYENLTEMVSHINTTEVPGEDVLSNSIYRYSRQDENVVAINYKLSEDQ